MNKITYRLVAALVTAFVAGTACADKNPRRVGFVAEPEAAYHAVPQIQRARGFLPEAVDLSNRMPKPGDQGDFSSCTAWAVAYAARSYYAAGQAGVERLDASTALSPAYVYNRLNGGQCNQPTSIMDALTLMRDEGVLPMRDFPYQASNCIQFPNSEQKRAASSFRIRNWSRLDTDDLDTIKSQIFNGHPVIVVLNLPKSFDQLRGNNVYDDRADRNFPHVMVAVGYDDRLQAFRLMNSWDTNWGDGGYVWVAYRAYSALKVDRAYVIDLPPPTPLESKTQTTAIAQPSAPMPFPASIPISPKGPDTVAQANPVAKPAAMVCSKQGSQPWPQCEIELNFKTALDARHGLSAQLMGAGGGVFKAGTSLGIEVTTPDFPTYLYISYLQASGDVVQLHWPSSESGRALAPGSRVILGGGQGGRPNYRIGPPFGNEAIVIVTSASPLFFGEIPKMQDDRAYLSAFRRAFATRPADGAGNRRVEAVVLPLVTVDAK
ncbi:MAG: C1 family peptidase [Azonexus sp.]